MPPPTTIPQTTDLAIGAAGFDILTDRAQALLKEVVLIRVFMNRESVDVTAQIKIGDTEVMPLGPSAVNATVGDAPIIPDDLIGTFLGKPGDRIQIFGSNANAAAQELRVIVKILAMKDVAAFPALGLVA